MKKLTTLTAVAALVAGISVAAAQDKGTTPPSSLEKGSSSATKTDATSPKTGSAADPKGKAKMGQVNNKESGTTPPSSLSKGSDAETKASATSAKTGSKADPKGGATMGSGSVKKEDGTTSPAAMNKGSSGEPNSGRPTR